MEKVKVTYIYTKDGGGYKKGQEITVLDIDATTLERHMNKNKVTRYPVEDGSTINDHSVAEPFELELEGVISNFPLEIIGSVASAVSGIAGAGVGYAFGSKFAGAVATAGLQFKLPGLMGADTSDRVQFAKDMFDILCNHGAMINVYTPIKVYSDMLIQKVDIDRTSKTATGLFFKASFIKVTIVSSEIVPVKSNVKSAGKSIDKGKTVATEVTGGKAVRSQSMLYKLTR